MSLGTAVVVVCGTVYCYSSPRRIPTLFAGAALGYYNPTPSLKQDQVAETPTADYSYAYFPDLEKCPGCDSFSFFVIGRDHLTTVPK